jgi:hypothetical protein
MNEQDVGIEIHRREVELGGLAEHLAVVRRELFVLAVQRVVDALGDGEEILAAFDDVPADLHAELGAQRHHAIENFRHPAADRGRIDGDDAAAFELACQQAELLQRGGADDRLVLLEHAAHARCSASRRRASRTTSRRRPSMV